MLEKKIRKQLAEIREEINKVQDSFNIHKGSGLGCGTSDERQLQAYSKMKHDEYSRLSNDLHNIFMRKIYKTTSIFMVISAFLGLSWVSELIYKLLF